MQDTSENIVDQILSLPVKRGPSGHLWYSYFLVWLYLFAPIISALYKTLSNKMRLYFVMLTVALPGILDYYQRFLNIKSENALVTTSLWMTLNYIGIMFIGRIIYDNIDKLKRCVFVCFITMITGLLGAVMITYAYGVMNSTSPHNFYMEAQLFPVLYGCGVLGLAASFRDVIERTPIFCKWVIINLSKYSIGIYFFHCLIIMMLNGKRLFKFWPLNSDGPIELIEIATIFYILSVISVILIAQIPPLKKFVT